MDESHGIPLDGLKINPNFDYVHQFTKLFIDDDDINDSPYGDCILSCDYFDEEQFINKFKHSDKLILMSINVQSLHAKFNELSEFILSLEQSNCNPCVIALQELWKVTDPDVFKLKGYQNLIYT